MEINSSTRKTTTNSALAVFFLSSLLLVGGIALYSAVVGPVRIENLGNKKSGVSMFFTFWGWLQQNQLLQTLFFGSVGTSTYFIIQKFYQLVVKRLYSYFCCEVTIHNMDPSYNAVIDYVTEKFLKGEPGATSNMQVQLNFKTLELCVLHILVYDCRYQHLIRRKTGRTGGENGLV